MLGAGEDQKRALLLVQHELEKSEFAVLLHFVDMQVDLLHGLGDAANFDTHRFRRMHFNQMLDRSFDGGRKEHCLAAGRGRGHDPFDGGQETHVQHAVGFIQHQHADGPQVDELAVEEIDQPSGGGDDHLSALADGLQLGSFVESADYDGGAKAGSYRHLGEGLVDLNGQLARGAQHQAADAAGRGLFAQQLNQGQNEGEGFTGTSLRRGDQVAPGQGRLDGLVLNRGEFGKSVFGEIALEGSREREF